MLAYCPSTDTPGPFPASLGLIDEINHRVIDEYAEAIAMLSLVASRSEPHVQPMLRLIADRLRDHAEAHRALIPPATGAPANLSRYIEAICASFTKAMLADRRIALLLKVDDIWLPADRCWRVGLVVAELVRSALRDGLRGRHGSIDVCVVREGGRVICFVGECCKAAPDRSPSDAGPRLVEALVSELGGAVRWSFTPRGSLAMAQLPIVAAGETGVVEHAP